MVKLKDVEAANTALVNTKPFVVVVAGGTAGIGERVVRGLATTFAAHGSHLRIHIIGRNEEAADKISSDCGSICPGGTFRFVQGNLTLIKKKSTASVPPLRNQSRNTLWWIARRLRSISSSAHKESCQLRSKVRSK
jgi:NAD(P)-dependent dehydrogenase (short-subunit alcohol dehydrogenase family)